MSQRLLDANQRLLDVTSDPLERARWLQDRVVLLVTVVPQ